MAVKNTMAKSRKVNQPYEIWVHGSWIWRVLKKWQSPDKEAGNLYARWFCAVKSPFTYGGYDLGDVYAHEIKTTATCIYSEGTIEIPEQYKHLLTEVW